jgi:hypothetical protein
MSGWILVVTNWQLKTENPATNDVYSASNRNEYQKHKKIMFPGGKAAAGA